MKTALLVIDMQNDYLWEKRKPIFAYDTERLVAAVNELIHLESPSVHAEFINARYSDFVSTRIADNIFFTPVRPFSARPCRGFLCFHGRQASQFLIYCDCYGETMGELKL